MRIWLDRDVAPKDQVIIADFGYPWATLAIWNPSLEQWAIVELEWNLYEGAGDPGFVTESQPDEALKGWMKLPSVPVRVPEGLVGRIAQPVGYQAPSDLIEPVRQKL